MDLVVLEGLKKFNLHGHAANFGRRPGVVEATAPDPLKAAAVLRAIYGYFTDGARSRGQAISLSGKITRMTTTECSGGFDLHGLVCSGRSADSCFVRFRGANQILDSTCTCCLSNNCPHACALANMYQRRLAGAANSRAKRKAVQRASQRVVSGASRAPVRANIENNPKSDDTIARSEKANPKIDSGAKEALVNLLKALQDKASNNELAHEPFLAAFVTYHLDLGGDGRLGLSVSSAWTDEGRLLKRKLSPAQLLKLAQNETLIDDALIARLLLTSIPEEGEEILHFPPSQERSDDLLRHLLASGRLYWGQGEDNPLLEGAARRAELVWTTTDSASKLAIQLLDDDANETTIVILDYARWYFDSSCGSLGPVVLSQPLSNHAIALLMSFPAVGSDELPYAREYLKATDRDKQLPLPSVPDETIEEMQAADVQLSVQRARLTFAGARALSTNESQLAIVTVKAGDSWIESRSRRSIVGCLLRMGFEISKASYFDCDDDAIVLRPINHGSISNLARLKTKMEALNWKISIDEGECRAVIDATDARWTARAGDAQQAWFDFSLGITVNGTHYWLFPIVQAALKSLCLRPTIADIERLNCDGVFYSPLPDGQLIALSFERVRNILSTLIQLFDESDVDSKGAVTVSFS
jgi:hypothetical protein